MSARLMPIAVGLLTVSVGLVAHLTGWMVLYAVYVRGTSCSNVDNFAYGVRWVALSIAVALITPALSFCVGRSMRTSAWGSVASSAVMMTVLAVPYFIFAALTAIPPCWS